MGEASSSSWTLDSISPVKCIGGPAPWKKESNEPLEPFTIGCPPLLLGGSAFGAGIFNDEMHVNSEEPLKVVRLAFQYGINAIDTSPYYASSEVVLGKILKTLEPEYPRESYYLMTKLGRFGPHASDFGYSQERIEESIKLSLKRLGTDYLDAALMHDVEFVSKQHGSEGKEGFFALDDLLHEEKFDAITEDEVIAKEDEEVLTAIHTLLSLKERGIVRNVGVSGYPLPVLLRLTRLLSRRPPYKPVDIILSYANHTLQCDLLTGYRETRFAAKPRGSKSDWQPAKLINASPFSMGLLTDRGPPDWHPAPPKLREACKEISQILLEKGSSLTLTASRYGIKGSEVRERHATRPTLCTIVGLSNVEEVHQIIHSYRVILAGAHSHSGSSIHPHLEPVCTLTPSTVIKLQKEQQQQRENETFVKEYLKEKGFFNWCWGSPPAIPG